MLANGNFDDIYILEFTIQAETKMRLLVCGGRDFDDAEFAIPRIHRLHQKNPVTALICGMAKGGDTLGYFWAKEVGVPIEEYRADWKQYGPAAGPIRNQLMLDE